MANILNLRFSEDSIPTLGTTLIDIPIHICKKVSEFKIIPTNWKYCPYCGERLIQ